MNIRNDNTNMMVSTRNVLEKELARKTVEWLKEFKEKNNKDFDLLNSRLPLRTIMFYYAFVEKIITLEKYKDKELVKEFKGFYDTCETYELLYYYMLSVDNAMCIQYELNRNLVIDGHDLAHDDLFVNTLLANISLVGLIFRHNLFEYSIEHFRYNKEKNDLSPRLERKQMHMLTTRFDLPFLISQDDLDESARTSSMEHVVESIVELGVKFKQDLYLKAVYGNVYNSLFSTKPYTKEQELFLNKTMLQGGRSLPVNGVYIVPEHEEKIHSIFVRESLFENISSLDCCIRYKDDTSSNLCCFKWREGYNMIQGIEPVKVLEYVLMYLGIEDYGMKYKVIEE